MAAAATPTPNVVAIDVDLNYDGDFDDLGERDYGTTELYQGRSYFQLNPALPATNELGEAYYVQVRTRVEDIAGNVTLSSLSRCMSIRSAAPRLKTT